MVKVYVSYEEFKDFHRGWFFTGYSNPPESREDYLEVIVPRNAILNVKKDDKGFRVSVRGRESWGKQPSEYIV